MQKESFQNFFESKKESKVIWSHIRCLHKVIKCWFSF